MRTGNLLFSAVQFLFVVALISIGGFLYALPMAPDVRFKLSVFFTDRPDLLRPVGIMVLAAGLILGIGFYTMYKRRFFRVRLSPHLTVELPLIRSMVEQYWKEALPEHSLGVDVFLHKDQKLEISLEMPLLDEEKSQILLETVEAQLGRLLKKQIAYDREFFVTVIVKNS